MPPFGNILKKVEIDDLIEFLSSCTSRVAPGCREWLPPPKQSQSEDSSDN